METIKIEIRGNEAERVAAAIMKNIYKTMAKVGAGKCHIDIRSERETELNEVRTGEILVPEFMTPSRRPIARLAERARQPEGGRKAWQ